MKDKELKAIMTFMAKNKIKDIGIWNTHNETVSFELGDFMIEQIKENSYEFEIYQTDAKIKIDGELTFLILDRFYKENITKPKINRVQESSMPDKYELNDGVWEYKSENGTIPISRSHIPMNSSAAVEATKVYK